ncbi:fumarylacetoacetate hydrolase family protein [Herbiconiux sp. CPCC 203407]|uniref:Fumarylacetoacetate hydrolase family protein n=1 Tax=Herbiconiux oxytropis TaxID=2970915 RepID=A0AA41XH96_9MICO|nr:fumarylacetoacetate hydrolase family protein [Herbiconiux oxytropis]MCS5720772.1 fumarylacetoacetate hydrolase family protein [Herbiconiux oxytropis]MCS5724901.1 fumarylacetoacetate hydrolase family protein [Herbiconiux oxytropis]
MKLATIRTTEGLRAARVDGDELALLPFTDVGALIASGEDWAERAASAGDGARIPLAEADFAPLTPAPEKVFCVGLNYASHAAEAHLDIPQHPTLFAKFARSLIGANDDLEIPSASDKVDWEIELGVVIGKPARHVSEADALDHVAGYTIVNDVSMRDWQLRTSQFLAGKTFEHSTPVGPFLVTPDEIDHARSLRMELSVDGEVKQSSATDDLVFTVPQIISYISTIITLVPGDLIATGTPAGVGHVADPPAYLTPGSSVTCSIEGLGTQTTRCVAAREAVVA